MFDDYGRPDDGYGQNQPYLDTPNYSRPQAPGRPPTTPLQSAIASGMPKYPVDPTMVQWRSRRQQQGPEKLGDRQHWSQPVAPMASAAPDPLMGGMGAVTGGNTGFTGGVNNAPQAPPPAQVAQQQPQVPNLPAMPSPYRDQLQGFDATKLANGHDSIKYRAAHVFENFAPNTDSMGQVLQALRASGLNVDQTGKDSFDFHDGAGPVDVGYGFGDPNGPHHWQWLTQPQAGAQPSPLTHAILSSGAPQQQDTPTYEAILQQLLQSLQP